MVFPEKDVWTILKNENRPVVMYGTGDGADKLFRIFDEYGIVVSDIFVSDEFFREREFHGYRVKRYSDIKREYDDPVIVLSFAVFRDSDMALMKEIAGEYTFLVPEVPVFHEPFFTYETFLSERKRIEEVYNLLSDEESKRVFVSVIKYRLTGDPNYLWDAESDRNDLVGTVFEFTGSDETYVDLGAYRGDTIDEFLQWNGSVFREIIALEPDKKNFLKLSEHIESLKEKNRVSGKITLLNKASWNEETVLSMKGGGGRSSSLMEEGKKQEEVGAAVMDRILEGKVPTYIKMDVEGAEKETIEGLKETLIKYRPKLSVSSYHYHSDLLTLPLMLHSINPEYRIYLRHHPYLPAWETNYYLV